MGLYWGNCIFPNAATGVFDVQLNGKAPMSDSRNPFPSIITQKLRVMEKTLRTYVALDGVATTILAVVAFLLLDFALDRFFEFSRGFRGVLLIAMLGAVTGIVWLRIGRRVFAPVRDEQWAMVLERFVPGLNESLITTVELGKKGIIREEIDPVLLKETVDSAARALEGVHVRRFLRYRRLALRILCALLVCVFVGGLCVSFAETAELWFSRNILLSGRDWPRRSQLIVDGFTDGRVRIGRGDSFTLTVRANTTMPAVPESVRLRLGNRDSGYRNLLLDQFRVDTVDGTDWRVFSYTFAELLETLPITVRGADSTIDGLLIEVVPPPILTDVKIRQEFPRYMNRNERTVAAGARTTVPDGTSVTVTATANKDLLETRVAVDRGEASVLRKESPENAFNAIEYALRDVRKDTHLEFLLEDVDHLRNRQPARLEFGIVPDQSPTVTSRLDGIGNSVTPVAVLPTLGEITDDNGLASARFRFSVQRAPKEENTPGNPDDDLADPGAVPPPEGETVDASPEESGPLEGTVDIPGIGGEQTVFALDREFSLTELNLSPGDRLSLHVEATDRFDLDAPAEGQTGLGPQWTLDVVTPERLRGLLEVREIALRQRFEVLIGEVERTKLLIEEFSLQPTEEQVRQADALTLPNDVLSDEDEEKREEELAAKKKEFLETISREQAGTGMYNISRALRDTQKEVYELRALVESFGLIRREMVNNRILTDETRQRLDQGIIEPIQSLVDDDFPEVDRRVGELSKTLEVRDKPLRTEAAAQRTSSLEQFDLLIKKMQSIRDNMVSMESFNEAIEILRAIIKQQQELRNETQEQRTRRLKNLLGE